MEIQKWIMELFFTAYSAAHIRGMIIDYEHNKKRGWGALERSRAPVDERDFATRDAFLWHYVPRVLMAAFFILAIPFSHMTVGD